MSRTFICRRCNKSFETNAKKQYYCEECQTIRKKEYHESYNKVYNSTVRYSNIPKRKYIRKVLKNKPKQIIDEYVEYCKSNYNTIEGCCNCICPECIQPEEHDKFLIWEKEGFYEEDYI